MRRWWLLPLGILIAGAALLALVRSAPNPRPVAAGPPTHDEIDEASRQRLEHVLREAERESVR